MDPSALPLRDIHLPEPISWWPPAIGWWIVALLILLTITASIWLIRRLTRKTAVKSAKKLLLKIQQNTHLDDHAKLAQISILIRRTAISIFPRAQVASLTGNAWLEFLDSSMQDTQFKLGVGRVLSDGPYQQQSETINLDALYSLCLHWLKTVKGQQS
jgi:hypothetical protein